MIFLVIITGALEFLNIEAFPGLFKKVTLSFITLKFWAKVRGCIFVLIRLSLRSTFWNSIVSYSSTKQ